MTKYKEIKIEYVGNTSPIQQPRDLTIEYVGGTTIFQHMEDEFYRTLKGSVATFASIVGIERAKHVFDNILKDI